MAAGRWASAGPFVAQPGYVRRLKAAGADREVRDELDASDHAPAWIELAAAAKAARKPRRR